MPYILDYRAIKEGEDFEESVSRFDSLEDIVAEYLEVDEYLKRYKLIRSDYSDPIEYLLRYIPESNYENILKDLEYMIADSKKELLKNIKEN